jgi:hypothetical protein
MGTVELEMKNNCAGEALQQFTRTELQNSAFQERLVVLFYHQQLGFPNGSR